MKKELNIAVSPVEAGEHDKLKSVVSGNLKVDKERITDIIIVRRSIDARNSRIRINLSLEVYLDEHPEKVVKPHFIYQYVGKKKPVVIVGAGPAGLFAALHLIEKGFKPIILERGKPVSDRKKDIAAIHGEHQVNPDSNYGFGEGGAGTFSDGSPPSGSPSPSRNWQIFHLSEKVTYHLRPVPQVPLLPERPPLPDTCRRSIRRDLQPVPPWYRRQEEGIFPCWFHDIGSCQSAPVDARCGRQGQKS